MGISGAIFHRKVELEPSRPVLKTVMVSSGAGKLGVVGMHEILRMLKEAFPRIGSVVCSALPYWETKDSLQQLSILGNFSA